MSLRLILNSNKKIYLFIHFKYLYNIHCLPKYTLIFNAQLTLNMVFD